MTKKSFRKKNKSRSTRKKDKFPVQKKRSIQKKDTKDRKYRMNTNENNDEKNEEIFNECTDKEFNLDDFSNFSGEKQELYEEYMKTASCFFKNVLPKKFKCTGDQHVARNFIQLLFYLGKKLFDFHAKHFEIATKRPYRGKISYPKSPVLNEEMASHEYYVIRNNIDGQNYTYGTYASDGMYPKIYSLLFPYFTDNHLTVYHKRLDEYHPHLANTYTLSIDYDSDDRKKIFFGNIKIGKYQKLGLVEGELLKVQHPHDIVVALYADDQELERENLIYQLGLKWCELLDIYEHDREMRKQEAYIISFEIYYLFVTD